MKGMVMNKISQGKAPAAIRHEVTGVVKAVEQAKDRVTLAHSPVKSLQWPAMTMRFAVNDKSLFDKLAIARKVAFVFEKQDIDYVVTAVQ